MELTEDELGLRYQVLWDLRHPFFITDDSLSYKSFCDPRLNFEQSLGMLFCPEDIFARLKENFRCGFLDF